MGINVETEELITITQARKSVPPDSVSPATICRWIHKGVRGVILETIVIGRRRLTSKEALLRFIAAQNVVETPAAKITPSQRRRQSEAAKLELAKMGVR